MLLINNSLTTLYTHALGNIYVTFPLDLSSCSGEHFYMFSGKSNMATQSMWPMMSYMWTFCFSWIGSHMCKVLPQSVQPFQRRFLKVSKKNEKTICLPNHMTDNIIQKKFVDHFIPRWPSKFFILISCGVLHMQLWRHNEGTYDVIKKVTHSPWGVLAVYQV